MSLVESLLACVVSPALLWDRQSLQILAANEAALTALSYARDDLLRLTLRDLGGDGDRAWRLQRKDGTTLDLDVRCADVDAGGRAARLGVADERRRDQQQQRLMMSQRLGGMAAAVAHELNNPLAYVISNLAFVTETLSATPTANDDTLAALQDARHGAERIRLLLRDLTALSTAEAGATASVDVARVVAAALARVEGELTPRARVVPTLPAVPLARANEEQLTQVLSNLLSNAAQAVPMGEADRHTVTIAASAADGHVRIAVHDDGCGIAPEILPRIFDPFFTTRAIGQGTGLGLSIAHRLVTSMGGAIEVESRRDGGSTFTVVLQAATPPPPRPAPAPAKRARVVILDDEPMVGVAVKRMLAREHDVTALTLADELFALLARENVDVLLCDLMMPLMTGMDVYAELKTRCPSLLPRMVFLSGGAFTPAAQSFLASVPNPRMEKPFDAAKLRALIASLLQ